MNPNRSTVERKIVGVSRHVEQHPKDAVQKRNLERLERRLEVSEEHRRRDDSGSSLDALVAHEIVRQRKRQAKTKTRRTSGPSRSPSRAS